MSAYPKTNCSFLNGMTPYELPSAELQSAPLNINYRPSQLRGTRPKDDEIRLLQPITLWVAKVYCRFVVARTVLEIAVQARWWGLVCHVMLQRGIDTQSASHAGLIQG